MSEFKEMAVRIRRIVRDSKRGAMLEASIIKLKLDDPEGPLCAIAGADETGKSRCNICAMSDDETAGCMKYVVPIQIALSQRNSVRAKIHLETLAERLDRAHEDVPILRTEEPTASD